jgi:drug/metabolite transporter (DMT)-like permease
MRAPDNTRGILWMIIGMFGFAVGDTFLKLTAGSIPPGQTLIYMGLGAGIVFAVLTHTQPYVSARIALSNPVVIARTLCEAVSALGFVLAFRQVDLSLVAAIVQVNPLIVTLGAALWLGERVGPHRIAAITLGMLGVLIVIEPWSATFSPAALWAVWGVVFLSARDLLTRHIPSEIPTVQLGVYAMAGLILAGLSLSLSLPEPLILPSKIEWAYLFGLIAMIPIGFYGTTIAMRVGEASVVSPFRYTRLLFALVLAGLVFDESPSSTALIGAALIVLSGLYAFWRERRSR